MNLENGQPPVTDFTIVLTDNTSAVAAVGLLCSIGWQYAGCLWFGLEVRQTVIFYPLNANNQYNSDFSN